MKNLAKPLIPLLLACCAASAAQNPEKPNIVVIMADDIGLGDIGFFHKQSTGKDALAPTPNIDGLIAEGMRFTDAHSPSSLCAPTRFAMMTGNYSYRNARPSGVWSPASDALIEPRFTTVARIAKAGGYHTAFFGKWGLGGIWSSKKPDFSKEENGARYFGFDYSFVLPQGIQDDPYAFYENQEWMKIKPDSVLTKLPQSQTGYESEGGGKGKKERDRSGTGDSNWDPSLAGPMLAKKGVAYIENQVATHPDEPFYMYYCSQAVHIPHMPPSELDGVKIAGATLGHHGDMIVELDTQVGMLVKALKKAGVYDNTLLVFTSDNGGLDKDIELKKAGHESSNGLSGKKGSVSEGGHRVPFVAVWPGKIKADSVSAEPIVGHDTVATIATLAGQPIDRNVVLDSTNLLPYFLGEAEGSAHQYLHHVGGAGPDYALREGDWKIIMSPAPATKEEKKSKRANKKGKASSGSELPTLTPIALYNLKDNLAEDSSGNQINNPEQAERVRNMQNSFTRIRESGEGLSNGQ